MLLFVLLSELRRRPAAAFICVVPLFVVFPAVAEIQGSIHDFSAQAWSGGEICNVCHTPHNANAGVQVPLWNHEVSTATYQMYRSPTLKIPAAQLQPGNISRLCLSCHDGTVAINSFGGAIDDSNPDSYITGKANLETNLNDDHPVGIYWDHQTQVPGESDCFACHSLNPLPDGTGFVFDPKVGNGLVFYNHRVECATCHDVHNTAVQDVKLLRRSLAGSEICLLCHPK